VDDRERNAGVSELLWLGRIAIALLASYVVVLGIVFLHPPAPPSGNYDEREHREHTYDHNRLEITLLDKPDTNPKTIGKVRWWTSPEHPPERSELSMRRGGKSPESDAVRYDLYVPGGTQPVGWIDHSGSWVILRFVEDPSKTYWMKSDQPSFSSWAE
jgi:hypothetical protein